jgi:7-cyano-7-deazaguanine synthase
MTKSAEEKAVVVLSGGQDSTTCLWWAIDRFGRDNVEAVTFDYGQRHRIELECAANVASEAGVPQTVLPIDTFAAIGGNALTDDMDVSDSGDGALPVTFVPGRNLVFLTFVAAWAWPRNITHIVTGVAQTDYSGYPDCRQNTMDSLEKTLHLGMERDFKIHTPLMNLSKAETVELAIRLGAIEALALTHTCYEGKRPPCGACQACLLRAKGFAEAGVEDPLAQL